MEPSSIQTIPGFPRKFAISEDYEKQNWATITDVELVGEVAAQQLAILSAQVSAAISNINHSSLLGVSPSQHHDKIHSVTHDGSGSDPLKLPLEFKTDGVVKAILDADGNWHIKGRYLRIE